MKIRISAFFYNLEFFSECHYLSLFGNAFVVDDVEFRLLEWSRDFVFYYFDTCSAAHYFFSLFYLRDFTNIQANRSVEFERFSSRSSFRIAKHHSYLHSNLVYKNYNGFRTSDDSRELAQSLRHQPRLLADMVRAHITLYLIFRGERCDRVYHHYINLA